MAAELKVINSFTKSFDINIPSENYNKQYDKSIKKIAKTVSHPGFRKGKVPASLVKKQYHESIHGETLDKLIQKSFEEACKENDINPIGNVSVVKIDVSDDNSVDLIVSFEVSPELTDLIYTGLEINKSVRKLANSDVDSALENLQAQQSKSLDIADDAEIKEGSFITVDSQQLDENKTAIEGKLYKNMTIEIGSGNFDKKIEKQLVGLKVGDDKEVEKKYPKNSKNKELAGTSEFFSIVINAIEEKETPELNDDFAKSIEGAEVETLEELKTKIKENLEERFETEGREAFMQSASTVIVEKNEFEVPASMVDNYLDRLYEQAKEQRAMNEERFKTARRESAEFEIKWQLIRDQIIAANDLKVDIHTEEGKKSVVDFIEKLPYGDDQKNMLRDNHQFQHEISYQVEDRKVIEFIETNNTIKEDVINPE